MHGSVSSLSIVLEPLPPVSSPPENDASARTVLPSALLSTFQVLYVFHTHLFNSLEMVKILIWSVALSVRPHQVCDFIFYTEMMEWKGGSKRNRKQSSEVVPLDSTQWDPLLPCCTKCQRHRSYTVLGDHSKRLIPWLLDIQSSYSHFILHRLRERNWFKQRMSFTFRLWFCKGKGWEISVKYIKYERKKFVTLKAGCFPLVCMLHVSHQILNHLSSPDR